MKIKVKYELVENKGDKPKKETTEIFLNRAMMPDDIMKMLMEKEPEAHSIKVTSVTEVKPRTRKKAAKSKDEPTPATADPDGEPTEADEPQDEGTAEEDDVPELLMEFHIVEEGCMVTIESFGEVVVEADIDFEEDQDPVQVGGGLIASVQGFLDTLAADEPDEPEE